MLKSPRKFAHSSATSRGKTKNIHLRLIAQYNRYSTLSKEMIHEKG